MPLTQDLNKFTTASPILASYSYTDIESGSGVSIFYLAKTADLYLITPSTIYSQQVTTQSAIGANTSYVKLLDIDFDISFNTVRTIKGTAIVNVPVGVHHGHTTGLSHTYVIVKLRHYDGTTETDLATNQGHELDTVSGSANTVTLMDSLDLVVAEKLFARGDTLRITVEQWGKYTAANAGTVFFGHDPKSRATTTLDTYTFGTTPTTLMAHIPFKLDI